MWKAAALLEHFSCDHIGILPVKGFKGRIKNNNIYSSFNRMQRREENSLKYESRK